MSDTSAIVKLRVVDGGFIQADTQLSNAVSTTEDDTQIFTQYGAIIPTYDPRQLVEMFERSTALRPNVDVYKTNIEGYGHRLRPTIDLEDKDADLQIADALMLGKMASGDSTPDVTSEEVAAIKLTLPAQMRMEKLRVEQFFSYVAGDIAFTELRERTRHDLEVTGNAYWEVLRDTSGRIAQLVLMPSVSMRLLRADPQHTEIIEQRKISALDYRSFKVKRRLRTFVQVLNGTFVAHFKELDDRRIVSANTGRAYRSEQLMAIDEPNARQATEVLHFKVHSPMTAYGVPRWIGATLAVLGSRAAEEVNVTYFDNKAVPPMAIMVSGGTLAKGAAERLETYIRDNIRGRSNFHKVLVLEAEGGSGSSISGVGGSRVRIDMKSLMEAQNQDALFQDYDANNTEKVGAQFRLPKILRGDMADFNRATAEAALEYAEQQVFAPERNKIDHIINRRILPSLGVRFYEFVSNVVATKDPYKKSMMVREDVRAGVLTPNEGREQMGEVYGKTYKPIDKEWAQQPLSLTIAALNHQPGAGGEEPALPAVARRLVTLRSALEEWEEKAGVAVLQEARRDDAEEVHLVPRDVWGTWFKQGDTSTDAE